ncbi:hypothetical protein N7528_009931 [Penicillium herquei]|nr:hypothetical protein N7528_009931 [Penicillium herquei]
MSSSPFNNFQTLLDQQVGTIAMPSSWPPSASPLPVQDTQNPNANTQRRIPANSLRVQGAAWATAGGGMAATLHGTRKIFRNFRAFRYI